MEVNEIKKIIVPILNKFGVSKAGLFGSFVNGKIKDGSDIDLLVEIRKDISLFEFIRLKLKLEETLGRKVDLVEYNTIKPRLKEIILNQELRII